jgi:hypothetical protein
MVFDRRCFAQTLEAVKTQAHEQIGVIALCTVCNAERMLGTQCQRFEIELDSGSGG